jgi:proteasome assembly chaperone (PAC2) family protein
MALFELTSEITLERPVMVAALSGWVDAGSSASLAASSIGGSAPTIAVFNSDELFDYRANRPLLDIIDGTMTDVSWPEITVQEAPVGNERVALLSGSEPDFKWQAFAAAMVDLAHRLDVTMHVTLGAVPAAVPHTLPPPVHATASSPALLHENARLLPGPLRVPSAAVSIVDRALHRAGIPTVGFFAQVPHYVTAPYYEGATALLEQLGAQLGVAVSLDDLKKQVEEQRVQLDGIVAAQPEVRDYVNRLQTMAAQEDLPSGEELAAEIQRFFSQQDGGQSPLEGGGNPRG